MRAGRIFGLPVGAGCAAGVVADAIPMNVEGDNMAWSLNRKP
jgi:hypothetical protein